MRAYKFLAEGARSPFTGRAWPLPADGGPGGWVDSTGPLELCLNGVHVCRPGDLPLWLDAELWEVETAGEAVPEERQLLVERARLVSRLERWNGETARELGLDCMRRAQTAAAKALEAAGLATEAERLEAAEEPDDVRRAGQATSAVAGAAGHRVAARVAYAAGTAGYHMAAVLPSPAGAVPYAAFSAFAATVVAEALEPGGYEAERARQAGWLAERLELR
jgi:hypothetical protein